MSDKRPATSAPLPASILVLTAILVAATVVAFSFVRRPATTSNQTTNSDLEADGEAEVTGQEIEAAEAPIQTVQFPSFRLKQFGLSVPAPSGFFACDDSAIEATIRFGGCAEPVVTMRLKRSTAWESMTPETAFDDAFGQELRESGASGIGQRGRFVEGSTVTALILPLSDSSIGAIVSDRSTSRRVSIIGYQQATLPVDFLTAVASVGSGIRFAATP